jgi:hypothetical protein
MRVLTEAYDEAITTMDRLGRTPLHFALSNAGRKAAPAAVRLLLSLHKDIVNASGGGPLPLRVLAEYAATVRKDMHRQRESVQKCLQHMLDFNPDPTADFFTALQSLPDWLRERAVVTPEVQVLLNEKISQRFPTGVLLADFFVQMLAIVFYFVTVRKAVDRRFDEALPQYGEPIEIELLIPLYLAALYFLLRTVIQILSLLALGAFRVWVYDPSNWLDVLYIFVVFYWSIMMALNYDDELGVYDVSDKFRTGATLSTLVLWTKLLAWLRNTYIDFSVFLGGLFHVLRRLVAFLLCLCITLIAFSLMFFTIYRGGEKCKNQPNVGLDKYNRTADLQCEENQIEVYCDRWSAFLNAFTMLLGKQAICVLVVYHFVVIFGSHFCLAYMYVCVRRGR